MYAATDRFRYPDDPMALTRLSGHELDELFRTSSPGNFPHGHSEGWFLFLPGTPLSGPAGRFLHRVAWQGKEFDARDQSMVNRVLPFGLRAVPAQVHNGVSRFDGKPCFILDYSRTSWIAGGVRDEIREVAPGLYLGLVYWHGMRAGRFVLRFPDMTESSSAHADRDQQGGLNEP